MKLSQLSLKNYTVFLDNRFDFCDGLNVFIGENGTGKTHIMKLLYSATQAANSRVSFSYKIVRTMLPDNYQILRLITRRVGVATSNVRIVARKDGVEESKILTLTFSSKTKKWDADVQGENTWQTAFQGEGGVFIPAKEILSNSYNLSAAVEKGNVRFDDTYIDILNSAKVDASLGRNEQHKGEMLKRIEDIIGGKVVYNQNKDEFYLVKGNSKQEFNLVSEGIRKMALIWQLVKNGMLEKGTVLFWDEPEANMNPSYIPIIADILFELSRNGIQVFLATHDYFLSKYLDARKRKSDSIKFHSFSKNFNEISYESSQEFSLLENNKILDTARMLYREEIGVISNG